MKKILIIDDDKAFLFTMEAIFKEKGFIVFKAETATKGFICMEQNMPDVVLLDIVLPDKNGFDVLKILKKNKKYLNIPVITITGDNTVQIDKAFELGAEDCFFKPLNVSEIIKRMEKI